MQLTHKIIDDVRPFSMVPNDALELTIIEAIKAIETERPGCFAEFGTWMGGSSFAMLLVQREKFGKVIKPVWMFDSFQGLPDAEERDGRAALEYQRNVESPQYYDNCTAPFEKVVEAKKQFGFSDEEAILIPGWFEDSVPAHINQLSAIGISLLRIDCDWYQPVKFVLDSIVPLVSAGSTIIIDDYFAWDGCALATHDFLSQNQLPYRIRSLPSLNSAWVVKRKRPGDYAALA